MDLSDWITKLKQALRREEVFAILDEFRQHEWSDEQRATVSRLYIRLLDGLKSNLTDPSPSQAKEPAPVLATAGAVQPQHFADDGEAEADGPVWYEKM